MRNVISALRCCGRPRARLQAHRGACAREALLHLLAELLRAVRRPAAACRTCCCCGGRRTCCCGGCRTLLRGCPYCCCACCCGGCPYCGCCGGRLRRTAGGRLSVALLRRLPVLRLLRRRLAVLGCGLPVPGLLRRTAHRAAAGAPGISCVPWNASGLAAGPDLAGADPAGERSGLTGILRSTRRVAGGLIHLRLLSRAEGIRNAAASERHFRRVRASPEREDRGCYAQPQPRHRRGARRRA